MAVAAREVAELRARRASASSRRAVGTPSSSARLRLVHLDDVRMRLERQAEPLPLGVDRHPHAGRAGLGDQVAIALVGRAARQRPADREPPARLPHLATPSASARSTPPRAPPSRARRTPSGCRSRGRPPTATSGSRRAPRRTRRAPPRPPAVPRATCRRGLAAARPRCTSAPSACAARATFNPLPPATCMKPSGRWMSPFTRRSISKSLSIDGFAARQTITPALPSEQPTSASSIVGWAPVPPIARVDKAPHAFASASASVQRLAGPASRPGTPRRRSRRRPSCRRRLRGHAVGHGDRSIHAGHRAPIARS